MEIKCNLERLGKYAGNVYLCVENNKNTEWMCGRGAASNLFILSPFCSRRHFQIVYYKNKFFIKDLKTPNGTFVNDVKVSSEGEGKILEEGDIICVGATSTYIHREDCYFYIFHDIPVLINIPVDRTRPNCVYIKGEELKNEELYRLLLNSCSVIHGDAVIEQTKDNVPQDEITTKQVANNEQTDLMSLEWDKAEIIAIDDDSDPEELCYENIIIKTENECSNLDYSCIDLISDDEEDVVCGSEPSETNQKCSVNREIKEEESSPKDEQRSSTLTEYAGKEPQSSLAYENTALEQNEDSLLDYVLNSDVPREELKKSTESKPLSEKNLTLKKFFIKLLTKDDTVQAKKRKGVFEEVPGSESKKIKLNPVLEEKEESKKEDLMKIKSAIVEPKNVESSFECAVTGAEENVSSLKTSFTKDKPKETKSSDLIEKRPSSKTGAKVAILKKCFLKKTLPSNAEAADAGAGSSETEEQKRSSLKTDAGLHKDKKQTTKDNKTSSDLMQKNFSSQNNNAGLVQNKSNQNLAGSTQVNKAVPVEQGLPEEQSSRERSSESVKLDKSDARKDPKLGKVETRRNRDKSVSRESTLSAVQDYDGVAGKDHISSQTTRTVVDKPPTSSMSLRTDLFKKGLADETEKHVSVVAGSKFTESLRSLLKGYTGRCEEQASFDSTPVRGILKTNNAPKQVGSSSRFSSDYPRDPRRMVNTTDDATKQVHFDSQENTVEEFQIQDDNVLGKLPHIPRNGVEAYEQILLSPLTWNVRWLNDYTTVSSSHHPPVFNASQAVKIPKIFNNNGEYLEIMNRLLMLELWTNIANKWGANKHQASFELTLESQVRSPDSHSVDELQLTGRSFSSNCIKVGDLLYLTFNILNQKRPVQLFGLVKRVICRRACFNQRTSTSSSREYLVNIVMQIKYGLAVDRRRPVLGSIVSRLRAELRPIRAVCYLHESPLLEHVLKPNKYTFRIPETTLDLVNAHQVKLSNEQTQVIAKLVNVCTSRESKLALVQGPVGSGKTHVIVGLVSELLSANKDYRILCCASSTLSVDELAYRLKTIQDGMPDETRFKVVRYGFEGQDDRIKDLNSIQELENASHEQCRTQEIENIRRADVICATLTSCGRAVIDEALHGGYQQTICIIDDASQCKEADALIPLQLDVKHLVLFGDLRQQTPRIINSTSRQCGLGQSLLHRMTDCIAMMKCTDALGLQLTTQYRSHPDIFNFPNSYMYRNKMKNDVMLSYTRSNQFHTYTILLHDYQPTSPSGENEGEAKLVYKLVQIIREQDKSQRFSIGVMAPSRHQCKVIRQRCISLEQYITINTISGYHGLERDIIILSAAANGDVGFQRDSNILNVALTRAKYNMYILLNPSQVCQSSVWATLLKDGESRRLTFKVGNNDLREFIMKRRR